MASEVVYVYAGDDLQQGVYDVVIMCAVMVLRRILMFMGLTSEEVFAGRCFII